MLRLPPFVVVQSSANKDTTANCGTGGCGARGRGLACGRRSKPNPAAHSFEERVSRSVNRQGDERSATFRALIDAINASDGIVYVEAGECGHDVTACLVGVTSAGAYRMLWIKVDKDSGSATSSHRSATNYSTQWKSRVTQTSSAALECFPITSGWDGEEVVHSSSKRPQPPMRASR